MVIFMKIGMEMLKLEDLFHFFFFFEHYNTQFVVWIFCTNHLHSSIFSHIHFACSIDFFSFFIFKFFFRTPQHCNEDVNHSKTLFLYSK